MFKGKSINEILDLLYDIQRKVSDIEINNLKYRVCPSCGIVHIPKNRKYPPNINPEEINKFCAICWQKEVAKAQAVEFAKENYISVLTLKQDMKGNV